MSKFLRKHPETLLIFLALVFLIGVLSYFSWGVGTVVVQVNRGVNAKTAGGDESGFDIDGAKALDLRGLVK